MNVKKIVLAVAFAAVPFQGMAIMKPLRHYGSIAYENLFSIARNQIDWYKNNKLKAFSLALPLFQVVFMHSKIASVAPPGLLANALFGQVLLNAVLPYTTTMLSTLLVMVQNSRIRPFIPNKYGCCAIGYILSDFCKTIGKNIKNYVPLIGNVLYHGCPVPVALAAVNDPRFRLPIALGALLAMPSENWKAIKNGLTVASKKTVNALSAASKKTVGGIFNAFNTVRYLFNG